MNNQVAWGLTIRISLRISCCYHHYKSPSSHSAKNLNGVCESQVKYSFQSSSAWCIMVTGLSLKEWECQPETKMKKRERQSDREGDFVCVWEREREREREKRDMEREGGPCISNLTLRIWQMRKKYWKVLVQPRPTPIQCWLNTLTSIFPRN